MHNTPEVMAGLLSTVGKRAVEAHQLLQEEKHLKGHLSVSFSDWKAAHGIEFVERGSDDWEAMLNALAADYAELENVRRLHRNARRRLETAIRWYEDAAWTAAE